MFREVMTYAQGHTASKQQSLYANLKQKLLAAWIWAFPAAWKSCFCHPDAVSVISCPLPRRIINSDWVLDFGFPPCCCCPQLEAALLLPWVLGYTLINPILSTVPPCLFFFFFFPPRAQMARFRVSCFRQSGATALVKEPEAQLIIVIAASYVRNASQAEGAQGKLPHCCCFPGDPWAGAWKWHVSPSEWTASDARREEALLLKMSTSQASRDSTKWRLPGPSESTRPWSYALPWYLATLVWWASYHNKQ